VFSKAAWKAINSQGFRRQVEGFDKDNLKEETFLKVFEYLNREELELARVAKISGTMANFIQWCRLMASYHVLVHPYKVRNESSKMSFNDGVAIKEGTELHTYAVTVDSFMSQFYLLKSFLIRLGVLAKDTHFAFNLSHVKFVKRVNIWC